MNRRLVLGFALLLMIIAAPTLAPVYAQPAPSLSTPTSDYYPFPGQTEQVCFTPSNNGDQGGFRPVIELVVPVNITFQGASFLGSSVDYTAYTIPDSGELTYNIDQYTRTVTGQPGAQVVVLFPPINNIPAGESTPPICADLLVTDDAVVGRDHLVNSTLIFAYGRDPLDNPNTDPPQESSPLTVNIEPSLIRVRKGLSGYWPADVVPTGPNYAFNYTITVSMANRDFTDLIIKDLLPEEAIYVKLAEVKNLTSGSDVTDYVLESEPTPGQYGGNLIIRIPEVRGNSGDTIEVKVTMYFPFYDKTGGELIGFDSPWDVNNGVGVTANYQGNEASATNQSTITASSMTYNKGVTIYRDNYAPGLSRYDILEYTISFWLSDYYNVSVITFDDTLGDGQRVLGNMTPVFYIYNGTQTFSGQFSSGSYTFGPDHSNPDGSTPLSFNLTKALEDQGIVGDLRGGMVGNESWSYSGSGGDFNPPFGRGRTWGYIKFWALVEDEYTSSVSGDQEIDSGDTVRNGVTMTSKYSDTSTSPPDIGRTTSPAIERPTVEKSIAYVNGTTPSSPVYVKAGDNVTYEVKVYIPTANADNLEIKDMLPLPVFKVDYSGGGQTPFSDGQPPTTTIPPPPGQWAIYNEALGGEDNVTSVTGIVPTLSVDTSTNELIFTYGSIHAGNNTLLVVDILYTLTATDEPYGDLLDLANLLTMTYSNSFSFSTQEASIKLVITKSPSLTLNKEVVSSTATGGSIANGDLYGADAGDTVTFQINVTNEGHNDAHDVVIRDVIQPTGADYLENLTNVHVYECDGITEWSSSDYTLTVSPSTTRPEEIDLSLEDNVVLPPGSCIVLRYDLTLTQNVYPLQTLINNGSIMSYSSEEGGPNFVDPNDPPTDDAKVTVAGPELEKEVHSTSNPDTSGDDLAIREKVVFRIKVTLPEGKISDMVLEDDWPEGFGYLNYAIDTSTLNGDLSLSVNVDETNRKLIVSGSAQVNADNDPSNDYFYVTLALKVLDDSSNVGYPSRGVKVNEVSLSWDSKKVDSQREVYVVEPHLTLSKDFNVTTADAGDWVEATLTLMNYGLSPAYEVNISDVLDGSVFDLSTVTEVLTPAGFTYSYDSGTREVRYSGSRIGEGEILTFKFAAKLRDDVTTLSSYTNVAHAEGSSMPDHLDGERIYSAEGSATLTIGGTTLTKQLVETSELATTGNKVTIGEIVIYNLTASIPEGVTHNVTFYDILPSNSQALMSFMNANVTTNKGGVSSSAVTLAPGSWTQITPTQTGNVLAFYLGDLTNTNNDPEPETITVRVKLLVLNLAENKAGSTLTDSFKIGYTNAANNYVYSDEVQHTLTVVEPQLWSILTANPAAVGWSGDEVILHFNVTNPAAETSSTAYDLDILSLLPPQFSGLQVLSVDTSNAGSVTDSSTPDELSLHSAYLEPGGWINVTFKVVLQPNAIFGQRIDIEACANATTTPGNHGSWNEIPGDPGDQNGERTGSGISPNDIRTCESASVTVGTPNVEKDVLTPKLGYAPGDQVRYQITVGTPKGSTSDLKVTDTLAEGLLYSNDLDVEVPSGVTFPNTPGEYPPFFSHTDTGTTEVLTFDFGSFTNSNSMGVNTYIRFNATVEDHASNVDGVSLSNEAILTYLDSNSNEKEVGPSTVSITVGEPELSDLSKTSLSDLRGGQVSWFLLTFRNSGSTTAYDTNVTDLLPPELRGGIPEISYVKVGDRTLSPSDYSLEYFDNGTVKVHLITPDDDSNARIEPGELVEIKIGARAIPHVPLSYEAVNSFSVEYSSRPGAPDEERTYSEGPASSSVYSPGPEVRKVVFSTVTPPPDPNDPTRSRAVVDEVIMYNVTFRMPQGTWAEDVEFHDTLPDGLEVINATARGINLTGLVTGTTSITESGGRYSVSATFGRLVDAEVNVTIYARVRYNYSDGTPVKAGDLLINGNDSNPSYYSWSNGVGTYTTYSNEVKTEIVSSKADLEISKSFDPKLLRFGDGTVATITVVNRGNGTAFNTVLKDEFCDSFEFLNASVAPDGISGNVITWEIGMLRPGDEWTVRIAFKLSSCGCFNNNATVSYINPGDPSTVEERKATDNIDVVKELEFIKLAEPEYLKPSETARFKLLVHNPTCEVINKLNFTDELPSGLTYLTGSSQLNGTGVDDPSISDGHLTWNTSLVLNPGESYLLEFSAKASPGTGGELTNLGGITGRGENGTVEVNDTASITVREEKGGVVISKEASSMEVSVNGTVRFTITIRNEWNVPIHDVDVWDILPCCMTFEGSSPGYPEPEHPNELPPGTVVMVKKLPESEVERCKGDRILKWHIDSLDPGETVTIEFEAKVRCSGMLKNVAEVFYKTEGGLKGSRRADALVLAYSVPTVKSTGSETERSSEGQPTIGVGKISGKNVSEGKVKTAVEPELKTETGRKSTTKPVETSRAVTPTQTTSSSKKPVTTTSKKSVGTETEVHGGSRGGIWYPLLALLILAIIILLYIGRRSKKRGGFGS